MTCANHFLRAEALTPRCAVTRLLRHPIRQNRRSFLWVLFALACLGTPEGTRNPNCLDGSLPPANIANDRLDARWLWSTQAGMINQLVTPNLDGCPQRPLTTQTKHPCCLICSGRVSNPAWSRVSLKFRLSRHRPGEPQIRIIGFQSTRYVRVTLLVHAPDARLPYGREARGQSQDLASNKQPTVAAHR